MQKKTKMEQQPMIVIRPIGRFGGLDNIHISLIVIVVLLFLLLLAVSYSRPVLVNNTNATGLQPISNSTEILALAERFLASYGGVNSSLSLLPYISNTSAANITYVASIKEWLVKVPEKNIGSNETFVFTLLIDDRNTSVIVPSIQTSRPSKLGNNTVVSAGVVKLYGAYACGTQSPVQVFWFIDPYASGAIRSLLNYTSLTSRFDAGVNLSIKIVDTPATMSVANAHGYDNATLLGRYVFCASKQVNFANFVSNLNAVFAGSYIAPSLLRTISNSSSLDYAALQSCIIGSTQQINAQALLANHYGIAQVPVAIVNCEYMSIPQTAAQAVCYTNSTMCH